VDVITSILLGLGIAQFILLVTRYQQSRPLRLGLFLTMFAASAWKSVQNYLNGRPLGLFDGFAMSFFGIAAGMELVALLRQRSRRG
jgi:uncharacterized membrane protein (UPF0182 family)